MSGKSCFLQEIVSQVDSTQFFIQSKSISFQTYTYDN
jgi:hypothetical protein